MFEASCMVVMVGLALRDRKTSIRSQKVNNHGHDQLPNIGLGLFGFGGEGFGISF